MDGNTNPKRKKRIHKQKNNGDILEENKLLNLNCNCKTFFCSNNFMP